MPDAADPPAGPSVLAATNTRARGAAVEAAALTYLLGSGLRQVAANANYRFGELDLVMRDAGTLVFVEVRYRHDARYGGGAASVDRSKRRKLIHAAQAFLQSHRQFAAGPCRFDVIDAHGDPAAPELVWIRDAFRADDG